MYRDLTLEERIRGAIHVARRTIYEIKAYWLLPKSMRTNVIRTPIVAFPKHKAYYPDLFMEKEKICVEIDGGYHMKKKQKKKDAKKDRVFAKHGFTVIRIWNEDVRVNVGFWQCLVEGLEKIEGDRPEIQAYIIELRQMIDTEIRLWTKIDSMSYYDEEIILDPLEDIFNEDDMKEKITDYSWEEEDSPVLLVKIDPSDGSYTITPV